MDKPMKSIKLPGLADTYTFVQEEDVAGKSGHYPDMTSGLADNLASEKGVANSDPYLFRSSPDVATHRKTLSLLKGVTGAWNQLVQNGNFANTDYWTAGNGTLSASNNELSYSFITVANNAYSNNIIHYLTIPTNHKVLISYEIYPAHNIEGRWCFGNNTTNSGSMGMATANQWNRLFKVVSSTVGTADVSRFEIRVGNPTTAGYSVGDVNKFRNVQIFDLTLMFGSSIADYVYSLEQATEGSGIAWLRSQGYFTKAYYPYDSGSLVSVKTSGAKMVGFNAWDESPSLGVLNSDGTIGSSVTRLVTGFVPVIAGTTYSMTIPYNGRGRGAFYTADKELISYYNDFPASVTDAFPDGGVIHSANGAYWFIFTPPANAKYVRYNSTAAYGTTYKNDICINLAWDNSRNGEYKPYISQTYPISDIDLRGIPTLDNGKIKYDGDSYAPDGTVNRKYGIVDLGTLTWSRVSAPSGIDRFFSTQLQSIARKASSNASKANSISAMFVTASANDGYAGAVRDSITIDINGTVSAYPTATYADAATFKSAMSGVYLVYELATPTTETTDPYTSTQWVDKWGTEEFIDSRDVPMPVGNETVYLYDLKEEIEYIAENIPEPPKTNGNYHLRATVSNGTVTYSWVTE